MQNSDRAEQGAWWEETAQLLDGEATFRDSTDVEVDHLRPEGLDLLDAAGPGARQLAKAAANAYRESTFYRRPA